VKETTSKAKLTTGEAYSGNQQFAGNGTQRSCGKCGKHKAVGGMKKHRLFGHICKDCQ
jgi:hypothetical protein